MSLRQSADIHRLSHLNGVVQQRDLPRQSHALHFHASPDSIRGREPSRHSRQAHPPVIPDKPQSGFPGIRLCFCYFYFALPAQPSTTPEQTSPASPRKAIRGWASHAWVPLARSASSPSVPHDPAISPTQTHAPPLETPACAGVTERGWFDFLFYRHSGGVRAVQQRDLPLALRTTGPALPSPPTAPTPLYHPAGHTCSSAVLPTPASLVSAWPAGSTAPPPQSASATPPSTPRSGTAG